MRFTELFYSIQGEGVYTGTPSIFLRLFGCNLTCQGFSNPLNEDIPIRLVDDINELKGTDFTQGCDSRYSWHKDYKHLAQDVTPAELAVKIFEELPEMRWEIGELDTPIHLVITGGEPTMHQDDIIQLVKELGNLCEQRGVKPLRFLTIETNASLPLKRSFIDYMADWQLAYFNDAPNELLFSNSPKMLISGEPRDKAWNPKVILQQMLIGAETTFKFVLDATPESYVEAQEYFTYIGSYLEKQMSESTDLEYVNVLEDALDTLKGSPKYVMPVGATMEQQNEVLPAVADQCMKFGFNLSLRAHVYAFGNELGT